ncbi:transporter substrate-binding domain-containing protein [Aminobacter aganoensis]|uniref:Polar amino acid transport system substrate-binding protein n=1 Tax=Aminobacter aganoensis TaxID=83264 RepID=A0A7X0KP37_9HYPH|nr:transporter substrate-binding domain-containing protein [Aminobacter aganoensis]MBB6357796.1 polar amino acid transport system substrate-binding protein [Aminobacter aganoensis]
MKTAISIKGLAVALAVLTTQLGTAMAEGQGKLIQQIKERGKVIVGMASFVPWAMRDKEGNWIGFEIDVANKLATDLGVQLELAPTAWDGIIPALNAGKLDVIVGGLSITPERQQSVDFTEPYSHSGVGVAANKELNVGREWPEGYNSADVTFTCKRGIMACQEIQKRFPKATLRQFDDTATAFQEVINGSAHASVSSEPAPTFYTLRNSERLFQPTKEYLLSGSEGMALRKGDPETIATLDAWIAKENAGGWLKERHDYWFRTRDWADKVSE